MSEISPHRPRPGEIALKEWLFEQAKRIGISPEGANSRFLAGKITPRAVRRVSKRTIFVTP